MIARRILLTLIITAVVAGQSLTARAAGTQENRARRGGWAARALGAMARSDARASSVATQDSNGGKREQGGGDERFEAQDSSSKNRIVGTWLISIPATPSAAGFNALQTFHEDGTFTETSDLLGQLIEGPAHGVYSGKKNDYTLTFELFAFDNGEPVGRVRVRVAIQLTDDDHLTGDAAVDFIEPDGNVLADIDTTPFSGTRLRVLPR